MGNGLSRRVLLLAGASVASLQSAFAQRQHKKPSKPKRTRSDWPNYGGTNAAEKYSPLDQIDRDNVSRLKVVWEWESPDAEILAAHSDLHPGEFQCTPIMI